MSKFAIMDGLVQFAERRALQLFFTSSCRPIMGSRCIAMSRVVDSHMSMTVRGH